MTQKKDAKLVLFAVVNRKVVKFGLSKDKEFALIDALMIIF